MTPDTDYFPGHDGLRLFEQRWMPAERPRASVVLIHGLIEHSGCHSGTALELVRQGYSVHAMDLRGHGRSEGPRCDVRTFDQYLLDLDIFFQRISRDLGRRPLFLMGNSMGGLIITLWAILRQPRIDGLILSGPLLALAAGLYPRLRYLAAATATVVPGLRITRIPFEWLASQRHVVDRFRDDPLVFHGCFTVGVAAEILGAMRRVSEKPDLLNVPLLILHGSQDRICGPAGSLALYQNAGCADKTLRLYDGLYHEVFDEPQRDQVLADLTNWLNQRAGSSDTAACRNQVGA